MRRAVLAGMVACVAGSLAVGFLVGSRHGSGGAAVVPEAQLAADGLVGSAAWELELGLLHERFKDLEGAEQHLSRAVLGQPAQALPAWAALGRVRQARGDTKGAIAAYEAAERARAGTPAELLGTQAGGWPAAKAVKLNLAALYAGEGAPEKAEALYREVLLAESEVSGREEVVRRWLALYRDEQARAERAQVWERLAAADPPDEVALYLLIGLARGAPGSGAAPDFARLATLLERLSSLHPGDARLGTRLREALEQSGQVEKAVSVARATAMVESVPTHALEAAECPPAFMGNSLASRPELAARQQVVWVYMRQKRAEEALAETRALIELGKDPSYGVRAYVLAANLYVSQRRDSEHEAALRLARAAARTPEERRMVEAAREFRVKHGRVVADMQRLYEEWAGSEDPCLRLAGRDRLAGLRKFYPAGAQVATEPTDG